MTGKRFKLVTTLLVVLVGMIVPSMTVLAQSVELNWPEGFPLKGSPSDYIKGTVQNGGKGFHCDGAPICGWDYWRSDHASADVLSTIDGTVIRCGDSDGVGNPVLVIQNDQFQVGYLHMDPVSVSCGDKVQLGQVVGRMGNRGQSAWTHLHYWVKNLATDEYYDQSILVPITPKPVPPPGPGPLPSPGGLIATLDKIFRAIKYVPGLGKYSDAWDKFRPYFPWAAAVLVVILIFAVLSPILGWIRKSKWAMTHDRKRKEFFFLSIVILLACTLNRENLLLMEMFKFAFGIWAFFTLSGIIYGLWMHFNYDPELEKVLKAGGADKWEWLREAILTPVIIGVLVAVLACAFGYFWYPAYAVTPPDPNPIPGPIPPGPYPTEEPVVPPYAPAPEAWEIIQRAVYEEDPSGSDPALAYAIWATETHVTDCQSYRHRPVPNACVSSAGATGPMQFMPGTWPNYADPGWDIWDLHDSTRAAVRMFKALRLYEQPTKADFICRFTGCDGGLAWNMSPPQAEEVWRIWHRGNR